ncbi:MAG: hypothetical protein ABI370_00240 [Gammaproteobacteria bacterium]
MKIKHLEKIIAVYRAHKGRFEFTSSAMQRIFDLYDKKNTNADIPDEVILLLLEYHWSQIKKTPNHYLNQKLSATEQAYIALAAAFDNPSHLEAKKVGSSSVKITTLMPLLDAKEDQPIEPRTPGVKSFSSRIDFTQPFESLEGHLFQYTSFVDALKEHETIENLTCRNNALQTLQKKDQLTLAKKLLTIKTNTAAEEAELQKIKTVVKLAINWHDHLPVLKQCTNQSAAWDVALDKIPERYFFKTTDNIGLDIRSLFFLGFVNPVTRKPIADEDLEKLKQHPHLGSLVMTFHKTDNLLVCPSQAESSLAEAKSAEPDVIDFLKFDLKQLTQLQSTFSSLKKRQKVYAHLSSLLELLSHLCHDNFLNHLPENDRAARTKLEAFIQFKNAITPLRKNIIWTEMTDEEFFIKASPVILEMKTLMGDEWVPSTLNFFAAMKEFAMKGDTLVAQATSTKIYTNNEYLVRVHGTALTTTEGAKKALKDTAAQFRSSFEIAYRYGYLPSLMRGMTPAYVCIAEKMRAIVPQFAKIASEGAANTGLQSIDSVFAEMQQRARKVEISRGETWGEFNFLDYYLKHDMNKTQYVTKDNQVKTLDEKELRDYLIDVLVYDIPRYRDGLLRP